MQLEVSVGCVVEVGPGASMKLQQINLATGLTTPRGEVDSVVF